MNVMGYEAYKKLNLPALKSCKLTIRMADGSTKKALGVFWSEIAIRKVSVGEWIYVIDAPTTYGMLLGTPWMKKAGVQSDWQHDRHTLLDSHGRRIALRAEDESQEDESAEDSETESGVTESDTEDGTDSDGTERATVYCLTKDQDEAIELGQSGGNPLKHVNNGSELQFDINCALEESRKRQMEELLIRHQSVFATKLTEMKQTDVVRCHVNLKAGEAPVCCRNLRRLSPEETRACEEQLNDLEAAKMIQPDNGPYGANLVFARKKDGQLRMCVNYSKLISKSVNTVWPIPNLEQCCEDLSGHQFYSVVDGYRGYFCAKMDSASAGETAFFYTFWEVQMVGDAIWSPRGTGSLRPIATCRVGKDPFSKQYRCGSGQFL